MLLIADQCLFESVTSTGSSLQRQLLVSGYKYVYLVSYSRLVDY